MTKFIIEMSQNICQMGDSINDGFYPLLQHSVKLFSSSAQLLLLLKFVPSPIPSVIKLTHLNYQSSFFFLYFYLQIDSLFCPLFFAKSYFRKGIQKFVIFMISIFFLSSPSSPNFDFLLL